MHMRRLHTSSSSAVAARKLQFRSNCTVTIEAIVSLPGFGAFKNLHKNKQLARRKATKRNEWKPKNEMEKSRVYWLLHWKCIQNAPIAAEPDREYICAPAICIYLSFFFHFHSLFLLSTTTLRNHLFLWFFSLNWITEKLVQREQAFS